MDTLLDLDLHLAAPLAFEEDDDLDLNDDLDEDYEDDDLDFDDDLDLDDDDLDEDLDETDEDYDYAGDDYDYDA